MKDEDFKEEMISITHEFSAMCHHLSIPIDINLNHVTTVFEEMVHDETTTDDKEEFLAEYIFRLGMLFVVYQKVKRHNA